MADEPLRTCASQPVRTVTAMASWTWTFEDGDGTPVTGGHLPPQPVEGFPSQADAEAWVGEEWRPLLAAGVDAVHLLADGERVYGPMSLRPGP